MATVKEVGERKLVDNIRNIIRPRSKNTVIGPGDDAAVLNGCIAELHRGERMCPFMERQHQKNDHQNSEHLCDSRSEIKITAE